MNRIKLLPLFLTFAGSLLLSHIGYGQVVVNGKNLNNDPDLEYIQLMYFIDKGSIKPVFFIDYGFIEPEYNDILLPELPDEQLININGEDVTDRVTVVWVLNKLHKSGWEYLGDALFVPLKVMNDWQVYTLKRKRS